MTVKVVSSYIVIFRIAQSAIHSTLGVTCSIEHHLGFSGKHNVQRLFVYKYPQLSIARYSFIQLSELE